MSEPTTKVPSRKRLFLFGFFAVIALVATWITYFLFTFDLGNYREQAEEKLSTMLSLPVLISDMHYNFQDTNLALHISGLKIGDHESPLQVDAPNVLVNLRWKSLLSRNFKFSEISIVKPQIWVRQENSGQPDKDEATQKPLLKITEEDYIQDIHIDALKIVGGQVNIEHSSPQQPPLKVNITKFNSEISDINLKEISQLNISGDLNIKGQEKSSHWELHGKSTLRRPNIDRFEPSFDLALNVTNLNLSDVRTFFPDKLPGASIDGRGDLNLEVAGSFNDDINFKFGLSSSNIALQPTADYTDPINIQSLRGSGKLNISGDAPGISNVSLQVDESLIAGDIKWPPQGQVGTTTIVLHNSALTLEQIWQWLPQTQKSATSISQKMPTKGKLQIEHAKINLTQDEQSKKSWQLDNLKGEIQKTTWDQGTSPAVEITSLPFTFSGNLWQIENGLGQWGTQQLKLNGSGKFSKRDIIVTSLDFSSDFQPAKFLTEWNLSPQDSYTLAGVVAINGHLEGPLDQLTLDMQADLSQFNAGHPNGLRLTANPEDKLSLHGTLSSQKISLDHAFFTWSGLKGRLSGNTSLKEINKLVLDAVLSIEDLSWLGEALPLLEKWKLKGQADLAINLQGLPTDNQPVMTLTLRDAGLRATRFIDDISQINGRAFITEGGLKAENLSLQLGTSPLTVQARIEDFSNPRLELDVTAPSIRAEELVFSSDKTQLRDINGHLEITRDGLTFAPVDVRLDGGTDASVHGTISFHPPFDVNLDISSRFARIDEVVELWSKKTDSGKKSPVSKPKEETNREKRATVTINAQVKQGDMYGMSFHDASGVIVPSPQLLSIKPLEFSVDEGFCNAQVLIEFSKEAPTLLRISGHAEDVDALEVYRELLNQENIVRGKLRGDFYLTGELGENYLPSSYGHFSVEVRKGVLHKFQLLSKVFSLLNVSQILALEIPDMDTEGMPFNKLTANFQLKQGVLKTKDLKIKSKAMNQDYTGKLNLLNKEINLKVKIHPLGTVDKIVRRIPIAGWLLTGKDRALLTAKFSVKGEIGNILVTPMPLDTLAKPTVGLLKRTLQLPFKLIEDPQILWGGNPNKKRSEKK